MDMRKNIVTVKHSIALVLFALISVFLLAGVLSYGFLTAKRTLADQHAAVDTVARSMVAELRTNVAAGDQAAFNHMGEALQAWLQGLRQATDRMQKQISVADGFTDATTWENTIEKTAVPTAWLANLKRSTQNVGKLLDTGEAYTDGEFVETLTAAARAETVQDQDTLFRQLQVPAANSLAAVQDMTLFIVNEDGTFAVPRRSSSSTRNEIWDHYHAQLVNEMRQQNEGWLYFPPKASWQIDQPQYALRFETIGDDGPVLAVETYFDSELSIMGQGFSRKVLAYFVALFLAAFILSGLTAYLVAKRLDALFTEFTGRSYLAARTDKHGFAIKTEKPVSFKKTAAATRLRADDRETLELKEKLATLKKAVYEQAIDASRVKPSDKSKVETAVASTGTPPEMVTTSRLPRQGKVPAKIRAEQKTKEVFFDDITIDMQGLRSQALKKLIGEFREEKREK